MSFNESVMTTSNVKNTLIEIANEHKIPYESLTFDILIVATYYKQTSSKKWTLLDEELKKKILQKKYLSRRNILFKEQYKIKVYLKNEESDDCQPKLLLITNQHQSKIILLIRSTTTVNLTKSCLQKFVDEIQRKLLLSDFFIGIFMLDLQTAVKPFFKKVKEDNGITDDVKIIISQALEPQTNVEQENIYHYLQKEGDRRTAYEKGVDEDELIFETILPVISQGGRDCKGKYLFPVGADIVSVQRYYFDETIKVDIQTSSLKFYALKSGYVEFKDHFMHISNSLSLENASLNTTGSITLGSQRDVDVKITSNDLHDDAINKGVKIDVSNIEVAGSVGENTSLKAESVTIGAHTHKTAQIESKDDANVYLHRGNLIAKNAKIEKLEQGSVQADTVTIQEVLGGEIKAKKVKITTLRSKTKIYASESIEIETIKGQDNKFYIAPEKIDKQEDISKRLEDEISKKENLLKIEEKNLHTRQMQFEGNYVNIDELKKQLASYIKKGLTPPKAIGLKIRQHAMDTKRIDALTQSVQEIQHSISDTKLRLEKSYFMMQMATISFNGVWDGKQEIFYEHPNSTKVEKYIPRGYIETIIYTDIDSDKLITVSE